MVRHSVSKGRMRWRVVAPFLVVVLLLAGVSAVTVDILSAVRAYVGGESLWSKGQKDALYYLGRYTSTHDRADYLRFQQALAGPLGDRRARLELEQPEPDLDVARQGFLEGGNHIDDVDGMVRLYLRFRHVSFMARAIDIWAEADAQIAELSEVGARVYEHIDGGDAGSAELQQLLARLPGLNEQLTQLEQRFSATLGEASRLSRRLVLAVTMTLTALLAVGGVLLTASLLRAQARSEQALLESNERWTLAADAAAIGVFDWDLERDRVALDARAAVLYGLPPEPTEIEAGQLSRERVYADDAPRLRDALRQAIAHPAPLVIRYRVQQAEGEFRHLELNARVRQQPAPGGVRMVGILWDVSDDVQAAQLQLDKEAAERANRAKGEFLSRVSHELRTPLNAVLGFAELMQTDPHDALTPQQALRVQRVLDSGRHLLELINDILDLSSLDDANAPLLTRPVPLAPLLRASLAQIEPMAQAQQVSLACKPPDERLAVQADPRRLGQVLANLLSNAVKYNRAGGEVHVDSQTDGDLAVITVHDTGAGLSAEQIAQLFQPFNRLGAEFSKVQGSGLGLVITQQLLKRMGGSLAVSSERGQGTSFVVRLRTAALA